MNRALTSNLVRILNRVHFYVSFDCDNCHKKIEKPECKACERMVNYFKVFDM